MSNKKGKKPTGNKTEGGEKMGKNLLRRLKIQYKIVDGKRLTYEEALSIQLKKQTDQLDMLKQDKMNVDADGNLMVSSSRAVKDKELSSRLEKLMKEKGDYEEKVKEAREKLGQVSVELIRADKELLRLRRDKAEEEKKAGSAAKGELRQVALLESKLAKATKELNKVVTANSELRAEIDGLLKERERFKELLDTSLANLKEGKGMMLDMVEQATIAYDHRVEAQRKLDALEMRSRTIEELQAKQIRELDRQLSPDEERVKFLTLKGQGRAAHQARVKKELALVAETDRFEEESEEYRKILGQLYGYYGDENPEEIRSKFMRQEEENSSLFGYVNQVYCEAEALHGRAQRTREAIDEVRETRLREVERETEEILKLEEKVREEAERARSAIAKREQAASDLEQMISRTDRLFKAARADATNLNSRIGDFTRVTLFNLSSMTVILEKRIIFLLQGVFYLESKYTQDILPCGRPLYSMKKLEWRKRLGELSKRKSSKEMAPCPLCVELERRIAKREIKDTFQESSHLKDEVFGHLNSPNMKSHLHSVSKCRLPGSRQIMQKRLKGRD